uniref:Uncharacterized protein n=1 Tax=Trichogramma kaykai TaxID=54128 RepID=A0ABD2XIR3_9HYME
MLFYVGKHFDPRQMQLASIQYNVRKLSIKPLHSPDICRPHTSSTVPNTYDRIIIRYARLLSNLVNYINTEQHLDRAVASAHKRRKCRFFENLFNSEKKIIRVFFNRQHGSS